MQKASNLVKPYDYNRDSDPTITSFRFTTDSGVCYRVYFTAGEYLFGENPEYHGHIKEFGFGPMPVGKIVASALERDIKIKYTILAILKEYIEDNIHVSIIYVCDYTDGRQRKRSKLFNRWFDEAERSEYKPDAPIKRYTASVEVEDVNGEIVITEMVLLNLNTCRYSREFANYFLVD